jgi:hypothetical protein
MWEERRWGNAGGRCTSLLSWPRKLAVIVYECTLRTYSRGKHFPAILLADKHGSGWLYLLAFLHAADS